MTEQPKRKVGAVTGAAATGGTLGAAVGQLIVHIFPYLDDVEAAVTVIVTAILAVVGGFLVPPKNEVALRAEIEKLRAELDVVREGSYSSHNVLQGQIDETRVDSFEPRRPGPGEVM